MRTIERVHFAPPTHIKPVSDRNHEQGKHKCKEEFPSVRITIKAELLALAEEIKARTHYGSHNQHWVESHKASLEESPGGHPVPTVFICIADDKAGKHKEEVHCKVSVVNYLVSRTFRIGLEHVEEYHQYGCDSTQSVKDFVSRFRGKV